MLIIFDVDGTLVDGEHADWKCFRAAVTSVLEREISHDFVCDNDEVTAPFLVDKLCRGAGIEPTSEIEAAIRSTYLSNLRQSHRENPNAFQAFPGARTLIRSINQLKFIQIGIISGDWQEAVLFKTAAAGIDIDGLPLCTGSLRASRANMLRLILSETTTNAHTAVYIGDGAWDLRAAREVGVRFIAVGHRRVQLKALGASSTLNDMLFQTVAEELQFSVIPRMQC